jgi:hypothetical protein
MGDKIQPSTKNLAEGGTFKNPESYQHITTPHSQADGKFWNDKAGDFDGVLAGPTSHSYHKAGNCNIESNKGAKSADHTYGTTVGKNVKRKKF